MDQSSEIRRERNQERKKSEEKCSVKVVRPGKQSMQLTNANKILILQFDFVFCKYVRANSAQILSYKHNNKNSKNFYQGQHQDPNTNKH